MTLRWRLFLLWWASILVSVPTGRVVVNALRERGLLAVSVALVFLLAALGVLWWLRRAKLPLLRVCVVVLVGVAAAALMERPEERLHVLQYGVLGWLAYGALVGRRARFWLAVVACGLLGWLDEGIQYFLPSRVYDLLDVRLNALSSTLGVAGAAWVEQRAPRGDAE